MNGFPHPFCLLTFISFCTQGLPGVAESTFKKLKKNLHPWEKVPDRADEWSENVFFHGPHPPSSTVTSSLEARVKPFRQDKFLKGKYTFR